MVEKEVPIKSPINKFDLLETIARGPNYKIKLIIHRKTKKVSFVKIIKKSVLDKAKKQNNVKDNYMLTKELKHHFILETNGIMLNDPRSLYIFYETIMGGEFYKIIDKQGRFPEDMAMFYLSQIILALEYLHKKKIVFRNLIPESILLDKTGYIKLFDFSVSKFVENKTYTLYGNPYYLSPEMIYNKGYGTSIDFWSLGVLMYFMVYGVYPFDDEDPMMIYSKILKGKIRFTNEIEKDENLFIANLLERNVEKRLGCKKFGFKEIFEQKWFIGFDWDELNSMKMNPFFMPYVKNELDVSNFNIYPDSNSEVKIFKKEEDIFLKWSV